MINPEDISVYAVRTIRFKSSVRVTYKIKKKLLAGKRFLICGLGAPNRQNFEPNMAVLWGDLCILSEAVDQKIRQHSQKKELNLSKFAIIILLELGVIDRVEIRLHDIELVINKACKVTY